MVRPSKILFLFIFTLTSCFTFAHPVQADFTDSNNSDEGNYETYNYFAAALYLQEKGILNGYPDGSFQPLRTINRAEFTKMVLNATHPEAAKGSDCFSDVATEWFAPYICGAKELGIIDGYSDGTFKPDHNINFAEAAKILTLAFGIQPEISDGEWYEPYVDYMDENNYLPFSMPGVAFSVNRGEMAEMVYNFYEESPRYVSYVDPYAQASNGKGLVRIGVGGSCSTYEVQDLNRNSIPIPKELQEALICSYESKFFNEDGRYFYYVNRNTLEVYDFEEKDLTTLLSLYETTENFSSISLNEAGNFFTFTAINFTASDYPTKVKLFVLEVDGDILVSKEKYDVKVSYDCSSNEGCFASSPTWVSDTQLEYFTCEEQAVALWEDSTQAEECTKTLLEL